MRLLVADYAGHPFQYDLAVELAERGHEVHHSYCNTTVTPQASFDHAKVTSHPIGTDREFAKYHLRRRIGDELKFGWRSVALVRSLRPDCIVTSNFPLVSLACVAAYTRIRGIRWVLWLQDIQSGLAGMLSGAARRAARLLGCLERRLVRRADHVVAISPEFRAEAVGMGAAADRVTVVENWAPLDDLPMRPRRNPWSHAHGLDDDFTFLYSGTLGMKHHPAALLALADAFADDPQVRVVVVSEGVGAEWLAEQNEAEPRDNLLLLPFQPFDRLPDVLGSADVLVVLLDAAAGRFSVPSKTLSYLCAGRPLLAAVPCENAAARLISQRAAAGIAISPGTGDNGLLEAARALRHDGALRAGYGRAARLYAEHTFNRSYIGDRFEEFLPPKGLTT